VRVAAVVDQLRRLMPVQVSVMAACDRRIWPASLAGLTEAWHGIACDAGVVQSDDVTVDVEATAASLDRWLADHSTIVAREAARLASGFDLVLGDVPSPAFDAAERSGIPAFAIANFSWDWIYSELGFDEAAAITAAGYAKAALLLEAVPFGPMSAFVRRRNVGLVAREPSGNRVGTRRELALGESDSAVLLAFQPTSAPSIQLPATRSGRIYLAPSGWKHGNARRDVRTLPEGTRFEDALAACDVVVGKPGYGLIGDVEAAGARFLYVPRPGFPENEVLVRHLAARAGTASLAASRLAGGAWEEDLAMLESLPAPAASEAGGALRAAREIATAVGVDSGHPPE